MDARVELLQLLQQRAQAPTTLFPLLQFRVDHGRSAQQQLLSVLQQRAYRHAMTRTQLLHTLQTLNSLRYLTESQACDF